MSSFMLLARYKNILQFCFRGTFRLLTYYTLFIIIFYFSVISQGVVPDKENVFLMSVSFIASMVLIAFMLVMFIYACYYVNFLYKNDYKPRAFKYLIALLVFNMIIGYVFFYRLEVKKYKYGLKHF